MSDSILNTNGQNEIDNDLVFVGAKNNNGQYMTGFTDKIFVIDLENLPDPLNPLNLPKNTIRVRTSDGNVPFKNSNPNIAATYETATLVQGTTDVYDIYKSGTNFDKLLLNSNNVVEILGANTSDITSMADMVHACTSLTSIPIFDTANVTNMDQLFYDCILLSTVPLYNTSNVTNMHALFYQCASLTDVPLLDTSNAVDMSFMFRGCTSLQTIPLFNTSNVETLRYMFYDCTSLISIPLIDTSNVKSISYMFYGCDSLATVTLFDTSNVIYVGHAFFNCKNVESGALALYQQLSSQANVPEHNHCFMDCGKDTQTGAAELAQIPSDWK